MAGFKNNYTITYDGITDNFKYQDLDIEITTPYDWNKTQDVPLLFVLIKNEIQKQFEKYHIINIIKN